MDNSKLPKGQSQENNGSGKPKNLPGIYRHEAAGKEVITHADPNDGSIQADALVRVGYHRVGDVPNRTEMHAMQEKRHKAEEEAAKKGKTVEGEDLPTGPVNGTTTLSVTELQEAKDKALAERDEARATLDALKAGKKTEEDKNKKSD